jgi:hypothetical protein
MAQVAEEIKLEGEEDGWELVIEDYGTPSYPGGERRWNVHGLASTGELRRQLTAMLAQLDEWERG